MLTWHLVLPRPGSAAAHVAAQHGWRSRSDIYIEQFRISLSCFTLEKEATGEIPKAQSEFLYIFVRCLPQKVSTIANLWCAGRGEGQRAAAPHEPAGAAARGAPRLLPRGGGALRYRARARERLRAGRCAAGPHQVLPTGHRARARPVLCYNPSGMLIYRTLAKYSQF